MDLCCCVGALGNAFGQRPPLLPAGYEARGDLLLLLPGKFHMPQPFPTKPGFRQQADPLAWSHGDWKPNRPSSDLDLGLDPGRDLGPGPGAEAGEAAWHHNEAFEQLCARLELVNARIDHARTALTAERPDLLDGVVDAMHSLKAGIAAVRAAWEGDDPWPAPAAGAGVSPAAAVSPAPFAIQPEPWREALGRLRPDDRPDPWDAETAEALMRVCEVATLEDYGRKPDRRSRRQPKLVANAVTPGAAGGNAVEARLTDVAERLQQALPRLDLGQWLEPIEQRLRQLELQVHTAFKETSTGPDAHRLGTVETSIRDLAVRIEHTRAELARFDAIEAHLREVLAQLKGFQATPRPVGALAAALRPGPDGDQTDTLEALLKSCAAARRQDARSAVGALQSIRQAIAQIVDRLDTPRGGEPAPVVAAMGETDPHADRDLLLKAYREGARALGETGEASYDADAFHSPARQDSSGGRWHWHAKD